MNKLALTDFSIRRPWLVMIVAVLATIVFMLQFPKVRFDNDPENMLSPQEYVRVFHNRVKEKFSLYDFVIVGVVNRVHPDGVFNVETLGKIDDLTRELIGLRLNERGEPEVIRPARGSRAAAAVVPDLDPKSAWKRLLSRAFRHDPRNLFDDEGRSVIIAGELISPSVVDNIKQAELGQLKIEYLMERPPETPAEARVIRDDAMNNPLYRGTLVSEDGKAICLYIPITAKTYSYNMANLVAALTAGWGGDDEVYITGQPVAQDTFGVEMLVQMATSAPLAGLAIFLLLLLFFRRVVLIIAPMMVSVVSVIATMGLLIGLGFDVHIMSSMIAIFLMPIAVADAIHILSEFFDLYHRFNDKAKTVRHVIGHLFTPMLYTSLTTIAGFASLGTTPIPPVRVFGLHVAFGVALAWLLTMTLIPAYIMIFVSEESLGKTCRVPASGGGKPRCSRMEPFLEWLGAFSYTRWRAILVATLVIVGVSLFGVSRIHVNDNPVKWFTRSHRIRVADDVLNAHFGGTYTAYLTLSAPQVEVIGCDEKAARIRDAAERRFAGSNPRALERFLAVLQAQQQLYRNLSSSDLKKCFVTLVNEAGKIDEEATRSWSVMADTINYLDPEGLTFDGLQAAVRGVEGIAEEDRAALMARLEGLGEQSGQALQEAALSICDEYTRQSFREFVFQMEADLTAPLFKRPEVLACVQALQEHLQRNEVVGKSSSAVDALKKANYELNYLAPPAGASPEEAAAAQQRNAAFASIPPTPSACGQVFTQLEGMKKKDSLFHLVTRDYQEANVWVQLKSGDNRDMEAVVTDVERFVAANPPPVELRAEWAGLTYLNVVWQDKMVVGMLSSLGSSFIVVLIMMMVLFRSPMLGLLSMIPLSVTIAFTYGLIGLTGKDYDMPVAILSALTLGLSVDFAIHFLERAREIRREQGTWRKAVTQMFKEPAMAISRNAVVISIGFLPLLFAPLVPYRTVGFFMAAIMGVSWLATLFILSALVTALQKRLFKDEIRNWKSEMRATAEEPEAKKEGNDHDQET